MLSKKVARLRKERIGENRGNLGKFPLFFVKQIKCQFTVNCIQPE